MYTHIILSQIPWTNTSLFHPLPRILHLANHLIRTRHPPPHRHVQVLHLLAQNTRRLSLHTNPNLLSLLNLISRLTYKPFPGQKLSAALARFAKKIPSLPFLPETPLPQHTHPPMTRRQLNSTLTLSPIV